MLVSASLAGLLAAWWMFPVGLVLWVVMIIIIAREPTTLLNNSIERRPALTQRFELPFNRIVRIQVSIFNTLRTWPAEWQRALQPVQDALSELVDETYRLCERLTPLENYLAISSVSDAHLDQDIKDLNQKLGDAEDDKIRQEYSDSLASMNQRMERNRETRRVLERLDAELMSLVNELSTLQGDVVRLRTGSNRPQADRVASLTAAVEKMTTEVKGF